MIRSRSILSVVVLLPALGSLEPALASEDSLPCNSLCQYWMSLGTHHEASPEPKRPFGEMSYSEPHPDVTPLARPIERVPQPDRQANDSAPSQAPDTALHHELSPRKITRNLAASGRGTVHAPQTKPLPSKVARDTHPDVDATLGVRSAKPLRQRSQDTAERGLSPDESAAPNRNAPMHEPKAALVQATTAPPEVVPSPTGTEARAPSGPMADPRPQPVSPPPHSDQEATGSVRAPDAKGSSRSDSPGAEPVAELKPSVQAAARAPDPVSDAAVPVEGTSQTASVPVQQPVEEAHPANGAISFLENQQPREPDALLASPVASTASALPDASKGNAPLTTGPVPEADAALIGDLAFEPLPIVKAKPAPDVLAPTSAGLSITSRGETADQKLAREAALAIVEHADTLEVSRPHDRAPTPAEHRYVAR